MAGVQLGGIAASFAGLIVLATLLAVISVAVLLVRVRAQGTLLETLGIGSDAGRAFELGGRKLVARLAPQDRRGSLSLSTPIATLPRLSIERLRWIDRLARRCRLAAVAATGADDFDRRYLVDCAYRGLAAVLLRDAAVRDTVRALFDDGLTALRLEHGQLTARFDVSRLSADDNAETQLQHWAAALAQLGGALPPFTGALTPIAPLWRGRRMTLFVACTLLPLLSLSLCAIWHDAYMPLDLQALARDALVPLPLLAAAALLAGALLLRGYPTSGRLLPVLIVATAVSTPAALIAAALLRNGHGDAQAPRTVVVDVTGRERLWDTVPPLHRWSSTQLQRRGLLGAMWPVTAEVAEPLWRELPTQARIRVKIAAGRLGHPWIVETEPFIAAPAATPEPVPVPHTISAAPGQALRNMTLESHLSAVESGAELLAKARALDSDDALPRALELLDRAIAALRAEGAPAATRAEGHGLRAALYARLGASFDGQREADARAALALAPTHAQAALLLDEVLFRGARFEEALQLWKAVLQREPASRRSRFQLARALATLGRTAEAKTEAGTACRAGETSACELLESL